MMICPDRNTSMGQRKASSLPFAERGVGLNKVYTLALGRHVDFRILLVIIPLIYLTEVLPISINGLGVRESAFAFFFVQIGLTVADALAVSVLIVGMRYLVGFMGGCLLLTTVIASREGGLSPRTCTTPGRRPR